MDLPFAVDSPDRPNSRSLHESNASSLVTASSQGSLLPVDSAEHVDVYSQPRYDNVHVPSAANLAVPSVVSRKADETEIIDFTYVTVSETDADEVDVVLEERDPAADQELPRGDVLAVLLSGDSQQDANEAIVTQCEEANEASQMASVAKQKGDLGAAFNAHSDAAKTFREAAVAVREKDASLFHSLLLLSQTHAKSALDLKRFLKHHPGGVRTTDKNSTDDRTAPTTHEERLRATVRGALSSRNEADISDSVFLAGKPLSGLKQNSPHTSKEELKPASQQTESTESAETNLGHNPVDEMMELERELRDMDMALEMGNSVMSLGTRTQNRLKQSTMDDGSFCVVPPGHSSYTSSSLWANSPRSATAATGTAGQRARANRVQSSTATGVRTHVPPPPTVVAPSPQQQQQQRNAPPSGLESSWWGNQSSASQMLASSFVHMGSSKIGLPASGGDHHAGQPTNTKQLMRLLDSIKTLGDENAALLREVEEAEAARNEAKAAREQMKRFRAEYGKRFESLKSALEKFRKGYPDQAGGQPNPVTSSDYVRSASTLDQIQRQEQLIRKLTTDLKKEKEENKKKDAALRKYESFYREVKARSAQKALMRQKEAQQQRQRSKIPSSRAVHR